VFAICLTPWWLPAAYFRIQGFERSGRLYELIGVRAFRHLVPDGDLANRWRRYRQPAFRIITNRAYAAAFVERTKLSEKSHVALLFVGTVTSLFAWHIGWRVCSIYLGVANVLVHVYPVLLQRYTRGRILRVLARARRCHQA
jgi:Glycosyl-4,4'-diaponeurosporenoate acyltransferase